MHPIKSFRGACCTWTVSLMFAIALAGCSASSTPETTEGQFTAPAAAPARNEASQSSLESLWKTRTATAGDFTVGPGDELLVSALGVPELDNRVVRVTGAGNIVLPLVGSIRVAGLTESQAAGKVQDQLEKYMYRPQVELVAKSDSSRLVAVTGAVRNPGVYKLNGPQDTVHALIERAGGLAANASQLVAVNPGQRRDRKSSARRYGRGRNREGVGCRQSRASGHGGSGPRSPNKITRPIPEVARRL